MLGLGGGKDLCSAVVSFLTVLNHLVLLCSSAWELKWGRESEWKKIDEEVNHNGMEK